ncbi:acyl-CoA thioesterase [Bradyrhizobium oropedii]|uniref:acyl-CoA thioesterase n=1 Tax=Bradyrhizobium oropedii TaxID=1571201 RepID=UPI001E47FAC2|nr:thioesterase family protein [Bradyrhizobium oropedii]
MDSVFEDATRLWRAPGGRLQADVHDAFLTGGGAFGGWILAVATRALRGAAEAGMVPKTLNAEFLAAAPSGASVIIAVSALRTAAASECHRARLHLTDGTPVAEATMLQSRPRDDPSFTVRTMPCVPSPDELQALDRSLFPGTWVASHDMRHALGAPGADGDGTSRVWTRLLGDDAMDFERLAALTDASIARSYYRPAPRPAIATVSISNHYHCTEGTLAAIGGQHVLIEASTTIGTHGYFDQDSRIWAPDGTLLATSRQLVRARYPSRSHPEDADPRSAARTT